jgi:hypothetical protein
MSDNNNNNNREKQFQWTPAVVESRRSILQQMSFEELAGRFIQEGVTLERRHRY